MSLPAALYADLAQYYDRFCAEVNYAEQCDYAVRAFRAFTRSDGYEYLDLACGTGQHLLAMQQHGFVPLGAYGRARAGIVVIVRFGFDV